MTKFNGELHEMKNQKFIKTEEINLLHSFIVSEDSISTIANSGRECV